MYSRRPDINAQIEAKCNAVKNITCNLPRHPFGHAFLWGAVTVSQKNGKPKTFPRVCLGSVCTDDLSHAVRLAESVPGVANVWYRLD